VRVHSSNNENPKKLEMNAYRMVAPDIAGNNCLVT
jgi:hypothetical protein